MTSLVGLKVCLHRLGAGLRIQRTLFVSLCLCVSLGLIYFVSKKDIAGKDPNYLDQPTPSKDLSNNVLLLVLLQQQVNLGRLVTALTQTGPIRNKYGNSGSNLVPTVASSATKLMLDQRSDDEEALLVDRDTKSMEDLVLEAATAIRNIPLPPYILAKGQNGPKYLGNSSCARFPTFSDIRFNNIYWQTLRTSNGTLYLYGAYFDIRTRNLLGPTLRILGMMDRVEPNVTTHCQIWFEGEKEPLLSKILEYKYIWYKEWGNYKQGELQPYLLACQVPRSHPAGKVPASVSLVEEPCDAATNNLRVLFNKPATKKGFAVCVKGLDYIQGDLSARLVEWIELLGILGANKIFIYQYALHPNATKVLRYYEQTGQIDVTPLTLPGGQPNDPRVRHIYLSKNRIQKRQNELIPYNDCLYRNLYEYEYIALLDIDEVIMPMNSSGWTELMLEVDRQSRLTKNEPRASYNFRQMHFVDNDFKRHERFQGIPNYMYMLQNVYRSPNHEKPRDGAKCFHNPERVLTLHNHFPMACLNGSCISYDVGVELAQVQHYRQDCLLGLRNCSEEYRQTEVLDTTIWRYKNQLMDRARKVLGYLGFISSFETGTAQEFNLLKLV